MESKAGRSGIEVFWPTVLSISLAVFGYLNLVPQFQSQRPRDERDRTSDGKNGKSKAAPATVTFPSRLWEDPLGEGYSKRKSEPHDRAADSELKRMLANMTSEPRLLVVTVPASARGDDCELRLRTRYAVNAALCTAGYRPIAVDSLKALWIPPTPKESRLGKKSTSAPPGELLAASLTAFLPVSVMAQLNGWFSGNREAGNAKPGGPGKQPALDAAQVQRFPVKKLFQEWGEYFVAMRLPLAFNFRTRSSSVHDTAPVSSPPADEDDILVPFERFRNDWARRVYGEDKDEVRYDDLLVFWLPVETSKPNVLRTVGSIRAAIFDRNPLKKWRAGNDAFHDMPTQIIGPYNSDLLLRAIREAYKIQTNKQYWQSEYGKVQLYPWRSTLELATLKGMPADESQDKQSALGNGALDVAPAIELWTSLFRSPNAGESELKAEPGDNTGKNGVVGKRDANGLGDSTLLPIRVTPVIGSDWHLAHLIRYELCLRGAWPGGFMWRDIGRVGSLSRCDGFIVLVTEKDTLYGNSIPKLYQSLLPDAPVSPGHKRTPLLVFRYLQGVEGNSPLQAVSVPKKDEAVDEKRLEHAQGRNPEGNYQMDCLRRMVDDIAQREREMKSLGYGGIRAIGIMGSDVYDKLLVLQAIRAQFPQVWCFTHDLDANFSRDSELPYSQNLLVASHFALSLHPALQRDVPPFRDSYQTSAFLSTLLAVRDERATSLIGSDAKNSSCCGQDLWWRPWLLPRVCPDYLSGVEETLLAEPPKNDGENHLLPLIFEIGRLGPYQLTETGPKPPPPSFFPKDPRTPGDDESFSLQNSVQPPGSRVSNQWSTWQYLSLLIIMLSGGLFVFFLSTNAWRAFSGVMFLREHPQHREPGWRWSATALSWFGIVVAIVLIVLIWVNHYSDDGQPFAIASGISAWPGILLRLSAFALAIGLVYRSNKGFEDSVDVAWQELGPAGTKPTGRLTGPQKASCGLWGLEFGQGLERHARPLWLRMYKYTGKFWWRFWRSLISAAAFFAFGLLLLCITGQFPNMPGRGSLARNLNILAIILSAAALCFITFFVVDVSRFAARFFRHLRYSDETSRAIPPVSEIQQMTRAVRAIARHSEAVNGFIWYPFMVMLLLVVARQPMFSAERYPPLLALIQFGLLFVLIWTNHRLRNDAQQTRTEILRSLSFWLRRLALSAEKDTTGTQAVETSSGIKPDPKKQKPAAKERASATKDDKPATKEQIEFAIKQIESEDDGAFGHWTQDELLPALSLPFLGETGFLLLQKLF